MRRRIAIVSDSLPSGSRTELSRTEPGRTELAAEAWEALFRAQVTVMRRLAADDIWDSISMREYDMLFTLSKSPRARLRLHDLNHEILLSQPSLSRMVERLEAAGLVARERDPADRRGTVVALTELGRRVQRAIGRRHAASIRRYVGPALERDELELLARLCTKLRLAQDEIEGHDSGPRRAHRAN